MTSIHSLPLSAVIDPESSRRRPSVDVVCRGDLFEMGEAQGAAQQLAIRRTLRRLRHLEAFCASKPGWLPFAAFRRFAQHRARQAWSDFERDASPSFERLAGLVSGARVSRGAISLLNALEPMVASVNRGEVVPPPGACSAVAIRGRRSARGQPVIARNFDYLPLVQPFYIVRRNEPRTGFRSLEFTLAPLSGAVDGINEHGLCVTYDYAYVIDEPTYAGTISMAISEALRLCRNVAEAARYLDRSARWGGGILMLADASGDIASLELSNTRSAIRRPKGGKDVLFHTNRFVTKVMQDVEVDPDAVYSKRAPRVLRGRRVHDSASARDRRLGELLGGDDRLDRDDLQAILADHGVHRLPDDSTVCVHGSYWYTTATLQLFPRSRSLRIAYDTACDAEFEEISL